jgi:DNA-binding SARP family transcriptional activator
MLAACTVLQVRSLGTFALRTDAAWHVGGAFKRGRELLQYFVSYPRVAASRETLVEALWPDADGESVAHRLHLAVSGARAALRALLPDVDAIRCSAGSYAWHQAVAIESDVETLLGANRTGSRAAMESAVALYAGEFLAGDNAEWMYPLRLRCSNAYVTMLERLAEAALTERDYPNALEWSLRLVEFDRAHEGATRLVMRALAASGRRGAALAQFNELVRYLRAHLAIEPSSQTVALRNEIVRGER